MKKLILIVEDNLANRLPMARLLRTEGFETFCARNGQDALDALKFMQPDLILLDLMMPAMGGVEFLKILRSDPFRADLPVIVFTGLAPHDDAIAAAQRLGAKDCFRKADFTFDRLLTAIRRHLQTSPVGGRHDGPWAQRRDVC